MSKTLVVFGATGQQGGSVVSFVLSDSELSQQYNIRAVTRDPTSEKVRGFGNKVEVVHGDVADRSSVEAALTGAHTVFAMTTPSFGPTGLETEFNHCRTIADVAVEKGVAYLIFSTLPSVEKISGGKYTKTTPFDAKARAEDYIRALPIKSSFFSPGSFMQNFQSQFFLAPRKVSGDTWVMARNVSSRTRYPLIDAVGDTGKFIGAVLAEPEKFEGKTLFAATDTYSLEEIVATISKITGKTVVYKQISTEDFLEDLAVIGPELGGIFAEGFKAQEEFNYFGPDEEDLVAWSAKQARGKLSTLEEYLTSHPLQLS